MMHIMMLENRMMLQTNRMYRKMMTLECTPPGMTLEPLMLL
jgi:hypothetical protein